MGPHANLPEEFCPVDLLYYAILAPVFKVWLSIMMARIGAVFAALAVLATLASAISDQVSGKELAILVCMLASMTGHKSGQEKSVCPQHSHRACSERTAS